MTWRAVDAGGVDLATGVAPRWPGWTAPADALAAAPVAPWPIGVAGDDGRRLSLAETLGPGGDRVEALLQALTTTAFGPRRPAVAGGLRGLNAVALPALAPHTPAGPIDLPLAVVARAAGVEAAARVDPTWLAEVDRRRAEPRRALAAAGREAEMEAALHVTMLVATERLDPADDADVEAHVASGAQLWLLAGAVVSALAGTDPDPFAAWAQLVAAGWWPIGPSGGRLVVSEGAGP